MACGRTVKLDELSGAKRLGPTKNSGTGHSYTGSNDSREWCLGNGEHVTEVIGRGAFSHHWAYVSGSCTCSNS